MYLFERLNGWAGRNFFYLLLGAIGVALLAGEAVAPLRPYPPYLLAFTMFVATSKSRLDDYVRVVRSPRAAGLTLVLFYLVVPGVGMALAALLVREPQWLAAYLLLWLGPSATISSVWTDLASGNVALSASLTGLTVFVSSVALPPLFSLWTGLVGAGGVTGGVGASAGAAAAAASAPANAASLQIDPMNLWQPLLMMVTVPAVLGVVANHRIGGLLHRYAAPLGVASKLSILVIVGINVAGVRPYLAGSFGLLVWMALVPLATEFVTYLAAMAAGRRWLASRADTTAVAYVNGMRNTVLAITLAAINLSPAATLPATVAFVVQEPLAVLMGKVLGPRARSKVAQVGRVGQENPAG